MSDTAIIRDLEAFVDNTRERLAATRELKFRLFSEANEKAEAYRAEYDAIVAMIDALPAPVPSLSDRGLLAKPEESDEPR